MRYLAIVALVAILGMIIAPAIGTADAAGYQSGADNDIPHEHGVQDGSGAANGSGYQWNPDGTGPDRDRDGSCQ